MNSEEISWVPQNSVLGPQEFTAYTEELVGLIDGSHLQPSPVRWWYAAAKENTDQCRRIHYWSAAAVHRGHPRMMFIQTSAVESVENGGHVARHQSQPEEDRKQTPQTACWEWRHRFRLQCSRPQSHHGEWAVDEETHQQGNQCLLLLSAKFENRLTHSR